MTDKLLDALQLIDENQQVLNKALNHCDVSIHDLYTLYKNVDESLRKANINLILSSSLQFDVHNLYSSVFNEIFNKKLLYINSHSKEILVVRNRTVWSAPIVDNNSFNTKLYDFIETAVHCNEIDLIKIKDKTSDTGFSKDIFGIMTLQLRTFIESSK